jgi:hypothetical protein
MVIGSASLLTYAEYMSLPNCVVKDLVRFEDIV